MPCKARTSRAPVTFTPGCSAPKSRPQLSSRSRAFTIGDAVIALVAVPVSPAPPARLGMDHIRIAIKDFNAEMVGRILREQGIAGTADAGALRITDPDGIRIELAAN